MHTKRKYEDYKLEYGFDEVGLLQMISPKCRKAQGSMEGPVDSSGAGNKATSVDAC
jgi:hypothetical protein